MSWSSQVAIVTGSSRGLGKAMAAKLASCGASICVNYITQREAAEQVVSDIRAAGGRAMAVGADVADPMQVNELVQRTTKELGPITILINNAAIVVSGTLDDYDHAGFERMRRINVDSLIHTTRAVMEGMRERGYGRIINLVSLAGIGTAIRGNAFYGATKAEVIQFTKRFAMELGPSGITVNALAPGFILTEMTREWLKQQAPGVERSFQDRVMMARHGTPEDIAHGAAFLASPDSSWITGQVLRVDGGRMDFFGP